MRAKKGKKMHSFQELYDEEERKYDIDPDANNDTPSLFFLYVMRNVLTSYIVFDSINSNNLVGKIKDRNRTGIQSIYYGDCELSQEIQEIMNRLPFEVPITTYPDFLIFLFEYLTHAMRRLYPSNLMKPCTDGQLDFPVSYRYFERIIVGMSVGEWKYLDEYGRPLTVLSGSKIDILTHEEMSRPTDGYYKRHTYHFNNGTSMIDEKYVSKSEAIELHAKWLARAKDKIQTQKKIYSNNEEGMKAQGYPYANTYEEYVRFLQTNLKDMKFGNYTLRVKDIFNFFIPCPLK